MKLTFRRVDLKHIAWRDALVVGLPVLLLVGLAFWATARFVRPSPPDRITLATGAPGGDYVRYGERYRTLLARHGVDLVLVPTKGATENLERLTRGEVEAALVQGGLAPPGLREEDSPIESLGALYPEVLWVFVRADLKLATLADLAGRRVAVGVEGSGTRSLAVQLLAESGARAPATTLVAAGAEDAARALAAGEVDAAFVISRPGSPLVGKLAGAPGVRALPMVQQEAYARQFAFLAPFTVPRGGIELATDRPAAALPTLAVNANLLVRSDLHPALMYLLLDAATEVHGSHSRLADAGAFPNPRNQDVRLASEADRFYRSGKPFLQRYLPFWVANLVDRLVVLLIPIVAVLLPALRFLPSLYAWRIQSRIARWYGRVSQVEHTVDGATSPDDVSALLAELDAIEAEANAAELPSWYAGDVYRLRAAIDLVRERLGRPGAKTLPTLREAPLPSGSGP